MVSVALVVVCGGCGSAGSDETVGGQIQSRTITHEASATRPPDVLPAASVTTQKAQLEESGPQVKSSEEGEDRNKSADPSLPADVAQDLTSQDAYRRYHALEHWESKDGRAPLDLVFEAMEDDDPAVRVRATAIVEQAWASEEEQEGK